MDLNIREIEEKDNEGVEYLIRYCLKEFGADHEGTAWMDPDLGRFFDVYSREGRKYWVAEDKDGQVVAGAGIGELPGAEGVCELQKMYALPEARGTGAAHILMDTCLSFAKDRYEKCYIETMESMAAAQKLYESYGFKKIDGPLSDTGHYACDVRYLKEL